MDSDGGGTPLHRPASLLDWRQHDGRYAGGRYDVTLLAPRRWEIRHKGAHLAFDESREAAFQIAERHHRDLLRVRDLLTWGSVAVAAAVGIAAVWAGVDRGTVAWVLVLAALMYTCISALARFVAALSRNLNDPYRRRLPWERRRSSNPFRRVR